MLPIKKIYIDTRHKTPDSISTSDFTIVLPETITLPEGAVCYVDDVCIPYSWYTITDNFNDKIYVLVKNVISNTYGYYIFKIEQGVYSSYTLTDKLSLAFQGITQAAFTVTYFNTRNEIQITCNVMNISFKILTPSDLATKLNGAWLGADYDVNNPCHMNEVLRNMDGESPYYNNLNQNQYKSGYLGLHPVRNIYMVSSNLGNYNTMGSSGERNILKKIPVIANPGELIYDKITSSSDYIDVSRQILRTLKFQLKDSLGNVINLHGANMSFSLVFEIMRQ